MILRDEIIEVIRKEIVGPSLLDGEDVQHEVLRDLPLNKYLSAILEPFSDEGHEAEEGVEEEQVEDDEIKGFQTATGTSQSSMGYSFFLAADDKGPLKVLITYGTYQRTFEDTFKRQPHLEEEVIDLTKVKVGRPFRKLLHEGTLSLILVERDPSNRFFETVGKRLFTLSVQNTIRKEGATRPDFDQCFYQVELKVSVGPGQGFLPYPQYDVRPNEDALNNRLLYRNVTDHAVGHGCSVLWQQGNATVHELTSSFLPSYELFPLNHRELGTVDLSMLAFYNDIAGVHTIHTLEGLDDQYEVWINNNVSRINTLPQILQQQAHKNITECQKVLRRFRAGILSLSNEKVLSAFRLMNWAMLYQQIRYGLPERPWVLKEDQLMMEGVSLPQIENPTTWPDHDPQTKKNTRLGRWRPFQIAFVVMNLNSLIDERSPERETVDLIWFPTGGGKTEAYLGLTAFTIIYNRMVGRRSTGTDILMRYTLRLLTAEQFQRAASLICACDLLRAKATTKTLGQSPITIGLWVGNDVTPNKGSDAVNSLNAMIQDDKPYNLILLKCPCCGKRMGKVRKSRDDIEVKGVRNNNGKVEFTCYGECDYAGQKLPIEVVDQYIYDSPPTLVIATVDKFAQLPWEPRSRKLLGLDVPEDGKSSALSLIIQDELHLISGPLGSLVGLYETLIDYLLSDETNGRVRPKIITSTATIALAKEQIKALYDRSTEQICVFPSSGLDHDDNFFAFQDHADKGRRYLGVFANSSPSFKTTQVRLMSIMLQAPFLSKDAATADIDPYYTVVSYFNTIKDLGYAVTFCDDDIPKRLKELHYQLGLQKSAKRYLNEYEELTSRKDNEEIPEIRQKLARSYPSKGVLDVCLATSMISVGIDIPRLSLMCMVAQPKSTAEYIQASSRVGRDKRRPGLVVMAYNARRSRDRSYFERFLSYHSRIYSCVEASGVTPFSLPTVERGLPGIIVGMLRLKEKLGGGATGLDYPNNALIDKVKNFILERCEHIDSLEVERTSRYFDHLMKRWSSASPAFYGTYRVEINGPPPLMIPYSSDKKLLWGHEPWRVLTSLRSVDKETALIQIRTALNEQY